MSEEKRIIEVNGIKMEVDLRHAVRIDNFKVGDSIKVLVKTYSDYQSFIGTIIGFDNFQERPTVVIAYLESGYNEATIKYLYYNKETKDAEITTLNDWDLPVSKETIVNKFQREIDDAEKKIEATNQKMKLFEELFGKYFEGKVITDKF